MTKGLEAIKRLKWGYDVTHEERIYLCECIEKELKRLEELEKAFDALSKEDEKAKKLLSKEIEKNRALEIIKDKMNEQNNSTWYFPAYVDLKGDFHLVFHKEEYKLLKEVIL